jgi:hypothetical protein
MSACGICGIEFRGGDDTVTVKDEQLHASCVEPHKQSKKRAVGMWAAMGSRGQMAMGAVQRNSPT